MKLYNSILISNRNTFVTEHNKAEEWKQALYVNDLHHAMAQLEALLQTEFEALSKQMREYVKQDGTPEDRTKTDTKFLDPATHDGVTITIDRYAPTATNEYNDVVILRVKWGSLISTVTVRAHGWFESGLKIDVCSYDFVANEWIQPREYKYRGPRAIEQAMAIALNVEYERPDSVLEDLKVIENEIGEEAKKFFNSAITLSDSQMAH